MPTVVSVAGLLSPCSFGACTNGQVFIGAQDNVELTTAGGATTTGTGGVAGTLGNVVCNGNATPSITPPNGYLSIDVNGTSRQYVLELPTTYDGTTPVPVLFAFHGSTTSAQSFLGQGYGNVRAGVSGRVLLVGPNALVRNGDTAWVDPSGDLGNGVIQDDVDFFDALVAQLVANYCIDTGRIFAMGHGDGAILSNQLACIRGNVVRGVGSFSGAGPAQSVGTGCVGKVAAFIGHDPKEGDPVECAKVSGGSCPWILLWQKTGWPTTQYWAGVNSCGDIGAIPTAAFDGNSTTGDPLPCKSFAGCNANYPVTLCLYDYSTQWDGPHAFPTPWGGKVVTDFFLGLPRVQ